ncbi:MAG: hypothetical protein KBG01_05970 [Syntrophobacterales bacterium]|jgi:hypothetical protein|nr:hypothetical protein [Syntrophobacterales bacterium]
MELGDLVLVIDRRHPLLGCVGKVVGKRGEMRPGDPWLLVYVPSRMRSYLIPQSMLKTDEKAAERCDPLYP